MGKFHTSFLPAAAGVLLLAVWPLIFREATQFYQVLGLTCLFATLALAWNIYALSGAISLGHAAFFGLGAYASALLNHHYHWSPLLTIPLGALASVAFAVFWSWGFRRLRGVYLGLASLAAMEIPKTIVDNWDSLTYGSMGIVGLDRLPTLALGGLEVDFGMNIKAQYYLLLGIMLLAAAAQPGEHPLQVGVDLAGPPRKRNRRGHARHCGQPGKGQGPDAQLLFSGHRRRPLCPYHGPGGAGPGL